MELRNFRGLWDSVGTFGAYRTSWEPSEPMGLHRDFRGLYDSMGTFGAYTIPWGLSELRDFIPFRPATRRLLVEKYFPAYLYFLHRGDIITLFVRTKRFFLAENVGVAKWQHPAVRGQKF